MYLNGQIYLEIWEIFCYYFIDYAAYPFFYPFSPSSMPMILRFGLLMELPSSCIFFSQLLSCLSKISFFFL
jgi:hypothetical protein